MLTINIDRVKTAFRKLKAYVYFDKTTLPLRDKIVKFESDKNFENQLNEIVDEYNYSSLEIDSPLMSEILSSISFLSFPKKMKKIQQDIHSVISVGNPKEEPIISESHFFIDMDVRGHILGVLWIMEFGKRLDDMCIKNSRGNRLRKTLIWDEENNIINNSPALFEPYFAQYSLWRDGGLSCARDMLNKDYDTLIITLDLKNFYYNTGITEEVFNGIIENEDDWGAKNIHSAIFAIINRYTQILNENFIENNGIVLPLGFLPSCVLSNWCLSKFDKGILDFWNPIYYGRYVDDIIIIEKIEKGSDIYIKSRQNNLPKEDIIEYYLGKNRRNNAPCFVEKLNVDISISDQSPTKNDKTPPNDSYRVNEAYCLSNQSLYEFQPSKMRIIALFAENNSTALLDKFKKEIYENVSEFHLMPEIGESFLQDDFSQFYCIEDDATINKIRGVKEIVMDKYELSKFLGKYRVVSGLVDDKDIKKFTNIIGKMLNNRELIENYILWERIFEIFITNKDYIGFTKFAKRIKTAINALTMETNNNIILIRSTQSSLRNHLSAVLNRVLSLLWGNKANEIIKSICDTEISAPMRKQYIDKCMSNKYIIPVPIDLISYPSNDNDVNFTDFAEVFKYLCVNPAIDNYKYDLFPYFHQAQDIGISKFIKTICAQNNDKLKYKSNEYYEKYISEIKYVNSYAPISIEDTKIHDIEDIESRNYKHILINIKNKSTKKLKIAIANVCVSGIFNLENTLKKKKPNRSYTRYQSLKNLVNAAIKEKADMLIFPENYIPFEWLSVLAMKAAREGLGIITGIEHLIVNDEAYNYTAIILPFKYFKIIPTAAIFFQLKNHYSPEEKRLIEGYGLKVANDMGQRSLYRWNDCYFPVYCCYELADIKARSEFMSWADMIVAVEYNKDTNYFGNIIESLTRDLHCYCVQVNTSEYGDSRITQPKHSVEQNLVTVKGGLNPSILVGEVDIQALRNFQIQNYSLQKNGIFKPTPPGIDKNIIRRKIENSSNE